ncbi:MAG: SO_0444 family Cu/Zn efflux transporter [Thermodesulfobacteriota bacterium]|nr:SO_0444 family Cu/Zn efflux transporter [Thermodesulfobacteriota bacterium]
MNAVIQVIIESWHILADSAVFMLFGFFAAGQLKAFLPEGLVSRHLGGGKMAGVFKASALGVPLPLCSCSVLPAAAGLREQRAGKGATASFLISTPETGVDSIAITYALLDPVMTVLRPISAFITSMAAGIGVGLFGKDDMAMSGAASPACNRGTCGCSNSPSDSAVQAVPGWRQRMRYGISYAFEDLLGDIGAWFIGGILVAGLIGIFVSPALVSRYLGGGFTSMLVMLVVSMPVYVCATASTPIAAALALKGVSPGAALVFLLAGPATNMASLAVVSKVLGRRATAVYLSFIIACSLGLGAATNLLYATMGMDASGWMTGFQTEAFSPIASIAAVLLLALIARAWLKEYMSSNGSSR